MDEVIRELSSDFDLIIISSSVTEGIVKFLENNNIRAYFRQILGADVHKSKVEKIGRMVAEYGIIPSETLIVTDSVGDVLEAKKAGIGSIAVTWGVHDKKSLSECSPDYVANTPGEILVGVEKLLS